MCVGRVRRELLESGFLCQRKITYFKLFFLGKILLLITVWSRTVKVITFNTDVFWRVPIGQKSFKLVSTVGYAPICSILSHFLKEGLPTNVYFLETLSFKTKEGFTLIVYSYRDSKNLLWYLKHVFTLSIPNKKIQCLRKW